MFRVLATGLHLRQRCDDRLEFVCVGDRVGVGGASSTGRHLDSSIRVHSWQDNVNDYDPSRVDGWLGVHRDDRGRVTAEQTLGEAFSSVLAALFLGAHYK